MKKWTAYTFVKNVYDIWMSTLLKKISFVIDNLCFKLNFELSHKSKTQISKTFKLLQQLENQDLTEASDSQLSHIDLQLIILNTSTQAEKPALKRKKKNKNKKSDVD